MSSIAAAWLERATLASECYPMLLLIYNEAVALNNRIMKLFKLLLMFALLANKGSGKLRLLAKSQTLK